MPYRRETGVAIMPGKNYASTPINRRTFVIGAAGVAFALSTYSNWGVDAFAAESTRWPLSSATWQDPGHVVLTWEANPQLTYEVYRCKSIDGGYDYIGKTPGGSFCDDDAEWPRAEFYRVLEVSPEGKALNFSAPIQAGTNAHGLSNVSVIMYHNFISQSDIANGITFDDYSLDPEDFRSDLQWLRDNGYTTITSDDVIDYINGKKPLPVKAVIISIDDGTWGVYTNAWPLLDEYGMKADFNIVGERIEESWKVQQAEGTRSGMDDPYCVWDELRELDKSGVFNICSHTYSLHRWVDDGRHGAAMVSGESYDDYVALIREDYSMVLESLGALSEVDPKTMAYPYSRRSSSTDRALLENTGYEILMAGEGARGTGSNWFVDGIDPETQGRLMSRPCRMEGHPISEYLLEIEAEDAANGVNSQGNLIALSAEKCSEISKWYRLFKDVDGSDWYAGPIYYAYVNGLLRGTSPSMFEPLLSVTRGMAITVLHRMAGQPHSTSSTTLYDVSSDAWYAESAYWAVEYNIMSGTGDGYIRPEDAITREEMMTVLMRYAEYRGYSAYPDRNGLDSYSDADDVSSWARDALGWSIAEGLLQGNNGKLFPQNDMNRAEFAQILQNWGSRYEEF